MLYAQVDKESKRQLNKAMQETQEKKWYCRLKIVEMSGQGYTVPQLAEIFDKSTHTIRSYIHRYNAGGIEGLQPDYGKSRAVTLDWDKEQWLSLLGQAPSDFKELKTGARNWTQEMVVDYLAHYHQVEITQAAISTMLKRVGLKWKRAKARIKSPDPLYVVKRKRVDSLKEDAQNGVLTSQKATHPPPGDVKPARLFYLDSTDLHWCPDLGQSYAPVGEQTKVDTPGFDNPWIALFGSLGFPSSEGLYSIHQHKRHQELLHHLQELMLMFPDEFIFVVLDNASAHTTANVSTFCDQHRHHIELIFLPTYSPHLNLIERLWRVMRHQVTRNRFFDSLDALAQAAVQWLDLYPFSKFCSLQGIDDSQFNFV